MFIVWGKKITIRSLGFVADFCSICRRFETFEVQRIGIVGHLYYVSFGDGELVGYERVCQTCHVAHTAEPKLYASFSKMSESTQRLLAKTLPDAAQVRQGRLELEGRISSYSNPLSSDERMELLREPFYLLNGKAEHRFAKIHIDWQTGLSLLALLFAFAGLVWAIETVSESQDLYVDIVLAAGTAAFVAFAWFGLTSRRRFARREMAPAIAKALQPLKPTDAELQIVCEQMRATKLAIGKALKPSQIRDALQAARS